MNTTSSQPETSLIASTMTSDEYATLVDNGQALAAKIAAKKGSPNTRSRTVDELLLSIDSAFEKVGSRVSKRGHK